MFGARFGAWKLPKFLSSSSPYSSPMPQTSYGPTLDASGVLASRLLEFLANKTPSAQASAPMKLGNRRRDSAEEYSGKIDPSDMKIARDRVVQCVPSLQRVSELCSMLASATEVRVALESKSGLSRFLQAREYRKRAKEALRFVKVWHITSHRTNVSHELTISRPSQTELEMMN